MSADGELRGPSRGRGFACGATCVTTSAPALLGTGADARCGASPMGAPATNSGTKTPTR